MEFEHQGLLTWNVKVVLGLDMGGIQLVSLKSVKDEKASCNFIFIIYFCSKYSIYEIGSYNCNLKRWIVLQLCNFKLCYLRQDKFCYYLDLVPSPCEHDERIGGLFNSISSFSYSKLNHGCYYHWYDWIRLPCDEERSFP